MLQSQFHASSLAFVAWVAFFLAGFFLLALALGIVRISPAILTWS